MTSRRTNISLWLASAASHAAVAAAGACLLLAVAAARAQEAPAQTPPADPPPAAAPSPSYQPGFIDAVGRWLEQGAARFKSDMQGAQENLEKLGSQARDAAKDVTGGILALPNSRVVTGRARCEAAPNGAPDCVAAANSGVCQGKGFQSGRSLDTQSEQKCPARLLLQGRAPNDTDCRTEMFVTRAVCQ